MELTEEINYKTAGYLKRFGATSVDAITLIALFHGSMVLVILISGIVKNGLISQMVVEEVLFLILSVYMVYILPRKIMTKQTMGEKIFNLKLMPIKEGSIITGGNTFIRFMAYIVVLMTGGFLYMGMALINFKDATNIPDYLSFSKVVDLSDSKV